MKKRKVNKAWNSYIEPKRHVADLCRVARQIEIRALLNRNVFK